MSVPVALALVTIVIAGAAVVSRYVQRGYIDYLTPLLGLYFLHSVSRGWCDAYWPELSRINPVVQFAGDEAIVRALQLTAGSLLALTLGYLAVTRFGASREPRTVAISVPRFNLAVLLLVLGLACRLVLRLAAEDVLRVPDSLATPVETLGWSALAGVFLMAYRWGRLGRGTTERQQAAAVAVAGAVIVLIADGRFAISREIPLQLGLALVCGRAIGGGVSMPRLALFGLVLSLPIFVWIGAMKSYQRSELGEGRGYVESMAVVRAQKDQSWPQFVMGTVQERFHGLDSVIVCQWMVPELRPYEDGSVWTQILTSAFVPRAIYSAKRVGWGSRFAVEFWGLSPQSEGSASVGISQIGNLYVYGGVPGCLTGMAVIGAGLGILAETLRRRRDALGFLMFFLTAVTVCQVDRDLEVSLGGVLKLLAIFAVVLVTRAMVRASTTPSRLPYGPSAASPGAELA